VIEVMYEYDGRLYRESDKLPPEVARHRRIGRTWHVVRDGVKVSSHATRLEARDAKRKTEEVA